MSLPVSNYYASQLRELLEDFDAVATTQHMALIKNSSSTQFRTDIHAALVAATLGLSNLDYAKRRYCKTVDKKAKSPKAVDTYNSIYKYIKQYINDMRAKLQTEGLPDPTLGIFGSSLVLERLQASFFAAHILYKLGNRFEGHAVSRQILEQLAWAYEAHQLDDLDLIARVQTTKAISCLKKDFPEVGRLYGFLSKKTHIDYSSHFDFLDIDEGKNIIWHARADFVEFSEVLLTLADIFGLVWEITQFAYIPSPETVELRNGSIKIKPDRPFLKQKQKHLSKIETISKKEAKRA